MQEDHARIVHKIKLSLKSIAVLRIGAIYSGSSFASIDFPKMKDLYIDTVSGFDFRFNVI